MMENSFNVIIGHGIAEKTQDAYSYNRYGKIEWAKYHRLSKNRSRRIQDRHFKLR